MSEIVQNRKIHRLIPLLDLFNHDNGGELVVPVFERIPTKTRKSNHFTDCPTWTCANDNKNKKYKIGDTCRDSMYDAVTYVCCFMETARCKRLPCWIPGESCFVNSNGGPKVA
eukprot:UN33213